MFERTASSNSVLSLMLAVNHIIQLPDPIYIFAFTNLRVLSILSEDSLYLGWSKLQHNKELGKLETEICWKCGHRGNNCMCCPEDKIRILLASASH